MQALEAKESALQNQCRDMEKLTGAHAKLSAQKDEAEQRSKELAERAGSQQRDLDKLKQQCAAAEDTDAKLHKQVVELELKLAARSHTTSKDAATATPSFVAGSMSASAAVCCSVPCFVCIVLYCLFLALFASTLLVFVFVSVYLYLRFVSFRFASFCFVPGLFLFVCFIWDGGREGGVACVGCSIGVLFGAFEDLTLLWLRRTGH